MAFCFTTPEQINEYYGQLKLVGKLDKNSGTLMCILLTRRKPKGRKKRVKEGYDTFHPAELMRC
jgi:hypothetical protein